MESSGRSPEAVLAFISNLVNRIARERGIKEALIAEYVLKEVIIRRTRDPRLLRLAFYYMGGTASLREEDQRLRRELSAALPSSETTIRSLVKAMSGHEDKGSIRDLEFIYLPIFAGA